MSPRIRLPLAPALAAALLAAGIGAAGAQAQGALTTARVAPADRDQIALVTEPFRLRATIAAPGRAPEGTCRFARRQGTRWVDGPARPLVRGVCRGTVTPTRVGPQRFRVRYIPAQPDLWRPAAARTAPIMVSGAG